MYYQDIKQVSKDNDFFRRVLYTTGLSQIMVMNLKPGEEIGEEVHPHHDQIFIVMDGKSEATVEGKSFLLDEHSLLVVTEGELHNIRNIGEDDLKLCTIYTPPVHKDGVTHKTRQQAVSDEIDVPESSVTSKSADENGKEGES
jgi:mannose-6-phosphate isomerase-like protein (cupin superfamily)